MSRPDLITPTEYEAWACAMIGLKRQQEAERGGWKPAWKFDYPSQGKYNHVLAALSEAMFAKHAGLYWPMSFNTFKEPDVPPYEVRTTLKVAESDPDYWPVVFMEPQMKPVHNEGEAKLFIDEVLNGRAPSFICVGWILAGDAKRLGRRMDLGNRGRPAYFLTSDMLMKYGSLEGAV